LFEINGLNRLLKARKISFVLKSIQVSRAVGADAVIAVRRVLSWFRYAVSICKRGARRQHWSPVGAGLLAKRPAHPTSMLP